MNELTEKVLIKKKPIRLEQQQLKLLKLHLI